MQRRGRNAEAAKFLGDVFGGIARGDKHQHARPAVGRDQMPQQLRAARAVDQDCALRDARGGARERRHIDAHRRPQQVLCERMHCMRKGR